MLQFGHECETFCKESTQQGMQAQGHNLKVMIKLTIIMKYLFRKLDNYPMRQRTPPIIQAMAPAFVSVLV